METARGVQDKDQGCWKQIIADGTRTRRRMLVGPRRLTFLFYWAKHKLFRLLVRLWRSIIEPNRAAGSHSKTIYSSLCRTFPFVRIARLEKRDFCITDRYRYTSSRAWNSLLKIRTQSCESAGNSNGIARGKRVFLPSLVVSLIFEVAFSPKFGSEIKLSRASINFTA